MALPAHRQDRDEVMEKIRLAATSGSTAESSAAPGPTPVAAPKPPTSRKEAAEGIPYLRRDVIVRHRRPRRLMAFLQLLAQGLLVAGLPIAGLTWAFTSPRLGLQEVAIRGTSRVPEAWVREAVEPWMGENLLQLSLGSVQRRLEQHPWLGGASVQKQLPDRLQIIVTERVPAALAVGSKQTFLVDSDGELIAALPEGSAAVDYPDLPVVRGAQQVPEDVARALEIHREFQGLEEGRLLEIEILGYDDYRLKPESWPYPLLVSAGSLREKHQYLGRLMAAMETRHQRVEAVDLRFAQRIVLQPEGASGTSQRRLPIRG